MFNYMKQSVRITIKEGKKTERLPAGLKKHYEESVRHNHELMKRLAHM